MSISACTDPFRLGDAWEVFPAQHTLRHPDREVRVEPKVMDVLCVLADAQGRTVLRHTLLETAWPDVVVEELSLIHI